MTEEKDEDLETLTQDCEKEEEQEPPKAKQYKKADADDKRKKKERTPGQIAALEKCRKERQDNRALRKQEREADMEAEAKAGGFRWIWSDLDK